VPPEQPVQCLATMALQPARPAGSQPGHPWASPALTLRFVALPLPLPQSTPERVGSQKTDAFDLERPCRLRAGVPPLTTSAVAPADRTFAPAGRKGRHPRA